MSLCLSCFVSLISSILYDVKHTYPYHTILIFVKFSFYLFKVAAQFDCPGLAKLLLEHKADTTINNIKNEDRKWLKNVTAMHYGVYYGMCIYPFLYISLSLSRSLHKMIYHINNLLNSLFLLF